MYLNERTYLVLMQIANYTNHILAPLKGVSLHRRIFFAIGPKCAWAVPCSAQHNTVEKWQFAEYRRGRLRNANGPMDKRTEQQTDIQRKNLCSTIGCKDKKY